MFKAIILICSIGANCDSNVTQRLESPVFDNELNCMHQWQEWYAKLAIQPTDQETIKVKCERIRQ